MWHRHLSGGLFLLLLLLLSISGLFWQSEASSDSDAEGRHPPPSSEARSAEAQRFIRWLTQDSPLAKFMPTNKPVKDPITPEWIQEFKKEARRGPVPDHLTPLVIVPSLIGTQLQAQLAGAQDKPWYCWSDYSSWYNVWFNQYEFLPVVMDCWFANMILQYNHTTGLSHNKTGVHIRVPSYGDIEGIDYLDPEKQMGVWNSTIEILKALGYEVGKSLRAAQYDWRQGPLEYTSNEYPRMKALIEETYRINNNSKVAIVSLSMGGPYFLSFLNTFVSQEWKDTYIHTFTSLDGAFGGSLSALLSVGTAAGWLSQYFPIENLQTLIQSYPSIVWLLPLEQVFGDQVWVTTPTRKYTTHDFEQLLLDSVHSAGRNSNVVDIFKGIKDKGFFQFDAPGVETHCFFGTKVDTMVLAQFNTTDFGSNPVLTIGDGDGTIPEAGLKMLEQWRGKQEKGIYSYPIPGLFHGGSVQNKEVLRMFVQILSS